MASSVLRIKTLETQARTYSIKSKAAELGQRLSVDTKRLASFNAHFAAQKQGLLKQLHASASGLRGILAEGSQLKKLNDSKKKVETTEREIGTLQLELKETLLQLKSYKAQGEKLEKSAFEHDQLAKNRLEGERDEECLALRSVAMREDSAASSHAQISPLISDVDSVSLRPHPAFQGAPNTRTTATLDSAPLNSALSDLAARFELHPNGLRQESHASGNLLVLSFLSQAGRKLDFEFRDGKGAKQQLVIRTDDEAQRRRLWRAKAEIELALKQAGFETRSIKLEFGT